MQFRDCVKVLISFLFYKEPMLQLESSMTHIVEAGEGEV